MKRFSFLGLVKGSIFLICLLGVISPSFSGNYSTTLIFSLNDVHIDTSDEYDSILMDGCTPLWGNEHAGEPGVPFKSVRFMLPRFSTVAELTVTKSEPDTLEGKYYLSPIYYEISDPEDDPFCPPDSSIYNSSNPYPEEDGFIAVTNKFREMYYADVAAFPIEYIPQDSILILYQQIEVEISTEMLDNYPYIERYRGNDIFDKIYYEFFLNNVVNPEVVELYYSWEGTFDGMGGLESPNVGFRTEKLPSTEGSSVACVIITNNYSINGEYLGDMTAAFEPLADWHTKCGIPTVIVDLVTIIENFQGNDIEEKIRTFLYDAYQKWGVYMVIIGGDSDIIPSRTAQEFNSNYATKFKTDFYYSDLDEDWNPDNDQIFLETGTSGDYPNLFLDPEIFVGRIPAKNTDDIQEYLDKYYSYARVPGTIDLPDPEYYDNYLGLFGIGLDANSPYYSQWTYNPNSPLNLYCNIYSGYLAHEKIDQIETVELWWMIEEHDGQNQYPELLAIIDDDFTWQTTMSALNNGAAPPYNTGFGLVLHQEHGYYFNLAIGDNSEGPGVISIGDLQDLNNGKAYHVLFTVSCYSANISNTSDIPVESFAKEYIWRDQGGGAAYIGNVNSSYLPQSSIVMQGFTGSTAAGSNTIYDYYSVANLTHLSTLIKTDCYPADWVNENKLKYQRVIQNIYGDPNLYIYTEAPSDLQVTHPTEPIVVNGQNIVPITIGIETINTPARVCLYKENEDYQYGYIWENENEITFNFHVETDGNIILHVTAHNFNPYKAEIPVVIGSPALLSIDSYSVDDSSPGTNGDGDSYMDAGETVILSIAVKNNGNETANNIYGNLVGTDNNGSTVFEHNDVYFGDIMGGATAEAEFTDQIAPWLEDESYVNFCLSLSDQLSNEWNDKFEYQILAPNMVVTRVWHSTNGTLPAGGGENQMVIELANIGGSVCIGLVGTLTSEDFQEEQVIVEFNDVEVGARTFDDRLLQCEEPWAIWDESIEEKYVFTFFPALQAASFNLRLDDIYGYLGIIEINYDTTPVNHNGPNDWQWFRPNSGYITFTWTCVTQDEHDKWDVFRNIEGTNEYVRLTTTPLNNGSVFTDFGEDISGGALESGTLYKYKLQNSRIDGTVFSQYSYIPKDAWTNNAYTLGWPVKTTTSLEESVYLYDIDHDGQQEVFTASWGCIYAFNGNGITLNEPSGTCFASPLIQQPGAHFIGSPVIADIDLDGHYELFAQTYNNKLYGYKLTYEDDQYWTAAYLSEWYKENIVESGSIRICEDSPIVCDLDSDGDLEIICYGLSDNQSTIKVFNSSGEIMWTKDLFNDPNYPHTPIEYNYAIGSDMPAIGNLDEDAFLEIAIAYPDANFDSWVRIFNHDGTTLNDFELYPPLQPISSGNVNIVGNPVIGDLDTDGEYELIVTLTTGFYVIYSPYDPNPTMIAKQNIEPWNWEDRQNNAGPPSLADINSDDDLEIIVPISGSNGPYGGTKYDAIVWDEISGEWEMTDKAINMYPYYGDAPIIVGKVDEETQDGNELILSGGNGGNSIKVFNVMGEYPPGASPGYCFDWPAFTSSNILDALAIGNIDDDPENEVIAASSDMKVYSYDTEVSDGIEWGQGHHDAWHTNNYHFQIPNRSGEITEDTEWTGVNFIVGDILFTNGATLTLGENCRIVVMGDYSITLDAGFLTTENASPTDKVIISGKDGISWDGIKIIDFASDDIYTLEYLYIKNARYGISIEPENYEDIVKILINHCRFENNEIGIQAKKANFIQIQYCTIKDCEDGGIYLYAIDNISYHIIKNCDIFNNYSYGICLSHCDAVIDIAFNHIHDNLIINTPITPTTYGGLTFIKSLSAVYYNLIEEALGYALSANGNPSPVMEAANTHYTTAGDGYAVVYVDRSSPYFYYTFNNIVNGNESNHMLIINETPNLQGPINVRSNYWGYENGPDPSYFYPTDIYVVDPFLPDSVEFGEFECGTSSVNNNLVFDLLTEALTAEKDEDYYLAYEIFTGIVDSFPDYPDAVHQSLPHILYSGSRSGVTYEDLYDYFDDIYNEYGSSLIGRSARDMRNDCSIALADFNTAIEDYMEILCNPIDFADSIYTVMSLNKIYTIMEHCGVVGTQALLQQEFHTNNLSEYRNKENELYSLLNESRKLPQTAIQIPDVFALHQNYPNPFNSTTNINYDLPEQAMVKLTIYNVLGQNVITLVDGIEPAGYHRAVWDGKSMSGIPVSSGLYICRIESTGKVTGQKFSSVKKMLMLK